jgi:C-terminal processing protease CtpA/Prc
MKTPTKAILVAGSALGLLLVGYFQGYVHGITEAVTGEVTDMKGLLANAQQHGENVEARLGHLRGHARQHIGQLNITVKEKPFGMHMRRGSVIVEEVFPGFPAEKLGVRAGCEVQEIAGEKVKQGTWLQIFKQTATPFNISFACPPQASKGHGPMSVDEHNYRVLVVKKPFGMNIQVNHNGNSVPRVVDVLPGSAAEAAGVRRGFVLTHVQEKPVTAENWHDEWNKAAPPCTLTFDISMPAHGNNPHFNESLGNDSTIALPEDWEEDEPIAGFQDVKVSVTELPFGMAVDAPPGKLPIVKGVVDGGPAQAVGVQAGDVLFKVAGHRVDSSTWFAAFQHAVPPFGLHFRRPDLIDTSKSSKVPLPVMPVIGEMEVTVEERPFGMSVKRGTHTIQEAFKGFPAQKLGIRSGCAILQIAGHNVSHGTWMDLFQHSEIPFKLRLFCGKAGSSEKKAGKSVNASSPLLENEHDFRVVVRERPFGMNIQTHVVPRVAEILPGYPAEAAGVKVGWVLTHINDQAVDAHTWFDMWQHQSPVGSVLTFDTNSPMHSSELLHSGAVDTLKAHLLLDDVSLLDQEGFSDFRCAVKKLPFGFEVSAPKGHHPSVAKVAKGSPAESVGVQVGDVLVEVAGLPVDSVSWFKAFQQASPPFGLHFRRPVPKQGTASIETEVLAKAGSANQAQASSNHGSRPDEAAAATSDQLQTQPPSNSTAPVPRSETAQASSNQESRPGETAAATSGQLQTQPSSNSTSLVSKNETGRQLPANASSQGNTSSNSTAPISKNQTDRLLPANASSQDSTPSI